jgi:hypothetical protein
MLYTCTFYLYNHPPHRKQGLVVAEWQPAAPDLPLGTVTWNFSREMSLQLNLHACHEDKYTCRGGSCVPADQRCNQQPGNHI